MPIEPITRQAIAERERIRKNIHMETPLLDTENLIAATREFARTRTQEPEFYLPFEVGHAFIQNHLRHWMETNPNVKFSSEEIKLLLALRGIRHAISEGHPDRQRRIQAAERLLEMPRGHGQTLYAAVQMECVRLAKMTEKAMQSLKRIPSEEEIRQPGHYAAMFHNPIVALVMCRTLKEYKEIL